MTELQTGEANGRRTVARQPDDPARPRTEATPDGAASAADEATETVRIGLAATAAVLHDWAGSLVGLPFTVLSRGNVSPASVGKVWLDSTFELVDVWWTVHRRSVDQLLASQRRTAAQVLDSGGALADLSRTLTRRSGPAEPRTAPPTPQ